MTKKIALITGANRGLGFYTAKNLLEKGYIVYLAVRNIEKGNVALKKLSDYPRDARLIPIDVANTESIEMAFNKLSKEVTQLDVLINNAGINFDSSQTAMNANIDGECKDTFDTNFFGAWKMIKVFHPLLKKSKSPRIVNVSSGLGSITTMGSGYPAYGTSKSALNALTKVFAAELSTDKILVNSICPGWCATDMGGSGGRSPELGAQSIVWAAELPDTGPTGGFFRDGKKLEW